MVRASGGEESEPGYWECTTQLLLGRVSKWHHSPLVYLRMRSTHVEVTNWRYLIVGLEEQPTCGTRQLQHANIIITRGLVIREVGEQGTPAMSTALLVLLHRLLRFLPLFEEVCT